MTAEEFWLSTSRELAAHAKTLERGNAALAQVLAALHNGPVIRKDKSWWTAEMFLGTHQPKAQPDESWKAMKAQLSKARTRSPEDRQELYRQQNEFGLRASRAAAAKASGASREAVMQIMEDFNG